jgi:predicted ATPase
MSVVTARAARVVTMPSARMMSIPAFLLDQALRTARSQQARSLELRAATDLARLWMNQGKRAEALDVLSSIYVVFTDGFETRDLQEAEALLAELRRPVV